MIWRTLHRMFIGGLLGGFAGLIFAPACQPCAAIAITSGIIVGALGGLFLDVFRSRHHNQDEPRS